MVLAIGKVREEQSLCNWIFFNQCVSRHENYTFGGRVEAFSLKRKESGGGDGGKGVWFGEVKDEKRGKHMFLLLPTNFLSLGILLTLKRMNSECCRSIYN